MAICDRSYPKRLAFSFLEELQAGFLGEYPLPQIEVVSRPYSFMKFGKNDQACFVLIISRRKFN